MELKQQETEILVKKIVEAIDKKKGIDIYDLHIGKLETAVCEHFIICHANSSTQIDAIASGVEDDIKMELKERPIHVEGLKNLQWVLIDYGDVVVHIFQKKFREFYNLENLWADAPVKKYNFD